MTQTKAAYTVRPVKSWDDGYTVYYQVTDGTHTVSVSNHDTTSEEYAQRVASILNRHDALVAALQAAEKALGPLPGGFGLPDSVYVPLAQAHATIRAALSAAGEA